MRIDLVGIQKLLADIFAVLVNHIDVFGLVAPDVLLLRRDAQEAAWAELPGQAQVVHAGLENRRPFLRIERDECGLVA